MIAVLSGGSKGPGRRPGAFLSTVLQPSRHRDTDAVQRLQISAAQWFNELIRDGGNARGEMAVSSAGIWHGEGFRCHFKVLRWCSKMAFFRTGQQKFGMTPGIARQADRVILLPSLRYPIILRPKGENCFQLVVRNARTNSCRPL